MATVIDSKRFSILYAMVISTCDVFSSTEVVSRCLRQISGWETVTEAICLRITCRNSATLQGAVISIV